LTGVRVLDIGTMIAAPFGASLLADFGADVIKVELPGSGDSSRGLLPRAEGVSLRWAGLNRNKRCITLDLKTAAGREVFLKLVAQSDLIIENFRPGTLDRWGLDYETLKAANPRIVVVRISGYGQTGPYREQAGFGTPATAFSGVTYLMGFPDRPPISPPFSLADYVAGMTAALAGVMALYHRDTQPTDEGQEVDVSLYEPLFRMLEFLVAEYDQLGVVRERTPGISAGASPTGTFETADGKWLVLVTSTERTWQRLPAAIGRPELLDDHRFATNADRVKHDAILHAILTEWFRSLPYAEAKARLDAAGCPVSLVYSVRDIFADLHYQARENIVEVTHPTLGTLKMPGIVPKFSQTPGAVDFAGPDLGAHNAEVLQGLLGLSAEEVARLREDGVV
jgi:formyl-CoA transferase